MFTRQDRYTSPFGNADVLCGVKLGFFFFFHLSAHNQHVDYSGSYNCRINLYDCVCVCVCVLQAGQAHQSIDNAADDMKDVLQDLLQTMEEAASQAGVVSNMIDSISKAIAKVSRLSV